LSASQVWLLLLPTPPLEDCFYFPVHLYSSFALRNESGRYYAHQAHTTILFQPSIHALECRAARPSASKRLNILASSPTWGVLH
jgi:hypothetical protein